MCQSATDKVIRAVAVMIVGLALTACGGNGGGGQPSVVYSGVTTQATVANSNAVALTTTAYQGGNSGGALALVGTAMDPADGSGKATARALTLSRVLTDAAQAVRLAPSSSPQVAAGAAVSVSDSLGPGTCGGSASYSGTANDVTGEFSATFTFNAWCNDGVTVTGRVTASGQIDLSGQNPELVSLEFSFSVLTVSDGTDTFSGSGTITASFGTSESLIIDMDFQGTDGAIYRASNLVITVSPTTGGESLTIEGRVYHPVHGYVDVTTPQALVVLTGDAFPSSGQLVATGSNNSSARLTALSSTEFQIDVDVDGNGSYETPLGTFTWGSV